MGDYFVELGWVQAFIHIYFSPRFSWFKTHNFIFENALLEKSGTFSTSRNRLFGVRAY